MKSIKLSKNSLLRDTRGANMVEYIIMVGLVALIALAGFKTFGSAVMGKIGNQAKTVGQINDAAGP